MQAYSDPEREGLAHALPDIEIFFVNVHLASLELATHGPDETRCDEVGWYWWRCFPGCLPDSDPVGPFVTAEEALFDARKECSCDGI